MSRKDILRTPQPKPSTAPDYERPARTRVLPMLGAEPPESSAATRLTSQVGNAFVESKARFERAEEIERRLAKGQAVVELDAADIDPSFVQDRMEGDIEGLITSVRDQGQQVPILVRPHPDRPGRYQIAFGHRRLRALQQLGLPVKAIVRDMTDEQLVVAQGQENNERQDLSFIEKARFAARLRERFPREVITSSMSIDKGTLSKMLSIVDIIPGAIIDAIGPAPGVGLPSWLQMALFIESASAPADLIAFSRSEDVQRLASAARFKAVLALKQRRPSRALPGILSTSAGDRLAQVTENKVRMEIVIDKRAMPDFAAFLREQVPALYEEHRAKQKPRTGE